MERLDIQETISYHALPRSLSTQDLQSIIPVNPLPLTDSEMTWALSVAKEFAILDEYWSENPIAYYWLDMEDEC